MLGSLHDADDALQKTLLRAWRALPRFGGPGLLRPWLYTIATNICLDAIARRRKRLPPLDLDLRRRPATIPAHRSPSRSGSSPTPTSRWHGGWPCRPAARDERREAVELAFIAALQHLPARQRAVLILRDVLGFSASEVAGQLDTTVASVNSALQRARRAADERLPEQSQQTTLRSLGDATVRRIVERYLDAWERGDVTALVALLAEDATFAMPPYAR